MVVFKQFTIHQYLDLKYEQLKYLGKFILIYFSSIVKQAFVFLCKSRSNPFLEPTSTKQFE